ncbi:hypothetical protein HZS_4394, partial [Henneguya salminicola]
MFIHIVLSSIFYGFISCSIEYKYHNYDQMVQVINSLKMGKCAGISEVYSIGKSVQGRDLIVMALSVDPKVNRLLIPETYLAANIHGNEPVGREVLLHLVEYICTEYKANNTNIHSLMQTVRSHFLFSANPDGFEQSQQDCHGATGRYNANNVDLNRNFPYLDIVPQDAIQPETLAIMNWTQSIPFVLSAVIHGGNEVVSYPLDGDKSYSTKYLPSEDNKFITFLAHKYANEHKTMSKNGGCSGEFPGGITNGAKWYPLLNSLQDYTVFSTNSLQLTLEISCCKYPDEKALLQYFRDNIVALLKFLQRSQLGVKGIIRDRGYNFVSGAEVRFKDGGKMVKTTAQGEFWKSLLPGSYEMSVTFRNDSGEFKAKQEKVAVLE